MTEFDQDRRRVLLAGGTALTIGLAGCLGGGNGDDGGNGDGGNGNGDDGGNSFESAADTYLSDNNAKLYSGTGDIVDETGSDSVSIDVGAGSNGFAFEPAAVRVSAGTEVTWEWTGEGGSHNVVSENAPTELNSGGVVQSSDETYVETLSEPGAYRYVCTVHQANGMYGAVIVEG